MGRRHSFLERLGVLGNTRLGLSFPYLEDVMAKPTSPSVPHRSSHEPKLHVDIRGPQGKIHVPVKNVLGATAIGQAQRQGAREQKGRG